MGIEKILQFENCPHSWPEDYPHENGKYLGKCVHCDADFLGHKRRPSCKKCHLDHLEKRIAELEPFKNILMDMLIVTHIYAPKYETDARAALHDVVGWEIQLALDPQVSSDAEALVQRGRDESKQRIAELVAVLNKARLSGDYRDLFEQCESCEGYIGSSEELLEDSGHSCDCHHQQPASVEKDK